jgi:uncharacterized protein involved in outer membrane biogenesis
VDAGDSLAEWHRGAHPGPQGRRWPRRLLIGAAATLVVTALLGFVVAAPIVRHIAVKQLGGLLGRQVTVSRVRVNPFTLSLTVEGLQVFEADGHTPFLGFSRLYVDVEAVSLFRRCLVVREVRLESLRGRVVRERGTTTWPGSLADYNFSDIVTRLSRPTAPAEPSPPAHRPRFSLSNIQIVDGLVTYEDRPTDTRHEIAGLTVAVPFVSSLPDATELFVKPRLSMRIDGAPFTIGERIKPFSDSLQTVAEVRVTALELSRLLPYLPVRLPVDVVSALLTLNLDVSFARRHQVTPTLTVKGRVALDQIAVRDHQGAPLVRLDQLRALVGQTDVFAEQLVVDKLAIVGLDVHARRLRDGTLDWQRLVETAESGGSPAKRPAANPSGDPRPRLEIAELTLDRATAHLRDETVRPGVELTIASMALAARNISNVPGARGELTFELHAQPGGVVTERGTFSLEPMAASGTVGVEGFELGRLAPYDRALLGVDVPAGHVRLTTRYRFEQRKDGMHLAFTDGALALANLVVRRHGAPDRKPILRVGTLSLRGATFDLTKRAVSIALVQSRDGQVRFKRDGDGQPGLAMAPTGADTAPVAEPWSFTVGRLDIDRWSAALEDRSVQPPVVWSASPLSIRASRLSTAPGIRSVVDLETGFGTRGHVALRATGSLNPVAADLRFDLRDIDLPSFQPYVAPRVSFVVTKGAVSASGQATLAVPPPAPGGAAPPPRIDLAATIEVANLASLDARDRERLIEWRSLRIAGLALSTLPFRLAVGDLALDDFAARLVHRADDTWNVDQPGEGSSEPQSEAATAGTSPSGAIRPISIGRLTLRGGTFSFVDRSIHPPFATDLGDIAAHLSASSSQAGTEVSGALSGRLDDFAPLTVAGKMSLTAAQPSADWSLDLRSLDLPSASPYSGKYLGYEIERGKLDLAVACHIVHGQLGSNVRLVISEPQLGPKVESPDATGVNVPRTVALLKDRHGTINLNLPIRGSFDHRRFKLGQTIRNAVRGVITKTAALPFVPMVAILDAARSERRSSIAFQPGLANVTPPEAAKINGLAGALRGDSGLVVEIEGRADPARDSRGDDVTALAWRRAKVVRDALARADPGAIARLFVVLPKVADGAGSRVELRLKKD